MAGDPWDTPEWHYIRREAMLVRQLIGTGATAIGRASYANLLGEYYTAFFSLSVGLERLAKLILVADHAITNNGAMPSQRALRDYGHKLPKLLSEAGKVATNQSLKLRYVRPSTIISGKIVDCLDRFADASKGRYANFAALGDPNLGSDEPIRRWWEEVAKLILEEHYYGSPAQEKIEGRARILDAALSSVSFVLYFNESGDQMQDIKTASTRTGQTEIVQRYGRYHALTIVRWLSEILSKLSELACYKHKLDAFYGVWEYFETYTVEDEFLKTRRRWPLH